MSDADDDADDPVAGKPLDGTGTRLRRLLWRAGPSTIAVALLVTIATHRYLPSANADALLPALMSTQRWTLFYWGQDRLANLVPLLAMPVRDPDWNFRFQTLFIASAFFAVGAAFVSYHYWSSGHRPRPLEHAAATLATGVLVMAPFQVIAGYRFIVEQLYFVTVLLFVGALYCWTRKRWYVPAAVLAQVALLVNPSLLLAAPFVWLVDVDAAGRIRRSLAFTAVMISGFVLTNLAARTFGSEVDVDAEYDDFAVDQVVSGVRLATSRIADSVELGVAGVILAASAAVAAVVAANLAVRARLVHVALPAFAALWLLAFGSNSWVAANAHDFRYFYPLYVWFMLVVAAATAEVVRRVAQRLGDGVRTGDRAAGSRWATASLGLAVFAAVVVAVVVTRTTSVMSLEDAREVVDRTESADVSIVVGDYWSVWPIVIAGRSDGIDLLGVTYRSAPIAGEVRRHLDGEVTAGRAVSAICSGVDADACAHQLGGIDGRSWAVDEVVSEQPLVVRLIAAPTR
jgi:hypothetical protein